MRLDAARWSAEKVARKGAKQLLWISASLFTGFTFVGYFTPIRDLAAGLLALSLSPWEGFWVLFYGLATYGNAGYLREQICMQMCPYARIQSALTDMNTMVIAYDTQRGENRGSRARSDQVMVKMNYPRGLIRYSSATGMQERLSARQMIRQVWRPRVWMYGALMLLVASLLIVGLSARKGVAVDVIKDRGALAREQGNGDIENIYLLKVMNAAEHPRHRNRLADGSFGVGGPGCTGVPRPGHTDHVQSPARGHRSRSCDRRKVHLCDTALSRERPLRKDRETPPLVLWGTIPQCWSLPFNNQIKRFPASNGSCQLSISYHRGTPAKPIRCSIRRR